MKLTLDALQILDAIDRNGSFGAAANELHKVRTALTYTINKLERDLGVTLFDRSGHRALLTQSGQVLLEQGRYLLEHAAALEQRVLHLKDGWEPKLRIAYDEVIHREKLMQMIRQFFQACPFTELDMTSEVLMGTWSALQNGRADLAIGVSQIAPTSPQFATQPLGPLGFVFAVAPDHPLASMPEPLSSETIRQYQSIVVADSATEPSAISYGLLTGQKQLRVSSISDKLAAHIAAIGVGNIPISYAQPAIEQGLLIAKTIEKPISSSFLSTAWRTDKQRGKAMQWLLRWLKKNGANLL